jgi:hypothetical protein
LNDVIDGFINGNIFGNDGIDVFNVPVLQQIDVSRCITNNQGLLIGIVGN